MADMEERISAIYNDCWKNYKAYLREHDMNAYNERSEGLVIKYDRRSDIVDLLLWFAPRVQALHEKWREDYGCNT